MNKNSEFAPTMIAFIKWYFLTLDPKFTKMLFGKRSADEGALQVFNDIATQVRGNRSSNLTLNASDYGAIMDRIAALHLRTRHGEDAVSKTALPL